MRTHSIALLAIFAIGCGKPSDAQQLRALLNNVAAGKNVEIDCRELPTIADAQLGELAFHDARHKLESLILDDTAITDDGVLALKQLPALKLFSASKTGITDAGVAHLGSVANLTTLRLDQCRVTDLGLAAIGKARSLRELSLWRCGVTDAGVLLLRTLPNLARLSLDETQITGGRLRALAGAAPAIRYLSVWQTKVSAEDAADLRRWYPAVEVNR